MTPETKICLSSADGHVGAPTKVYKDYIEKTLHSDFDNYYKSHMWRWAPQSKDSFFPREINAKMWNTEGFDPELGSPVAWDATMRLKAQDEARVACEVLFPDDQNANDPPWGSGLAGGAVGGAHGGLDFPASYVRAGARAYNRWLADFCSADNNRLQGIILLGTMEDTIWCVEEIRRAYDSGLRAGVMLPLDYDLPYYHHPRYDMVWATCQELGLPLITHVSRGHPKWLGDDPWVQRFLYVHESMWYAQRPVWCMVMGGVFERFPNLHLVITELGINWVPPLIAQLDGYMGWWPEMRASRDVPGRVTKLQMKPSEYWQRNIFVSHTTAQKRDEFESPAYESVPNMIFGIDIGHSEGWWPVLGWPDPVAKGSQPMPPVSIEAGYKQIWSGLPSDKIMPYFEYNCFRAYPNIDRTALQPAVDRIGPTVAEIGLAV
jgi:predicted TIM-barrel fold metal-dependent hydrolase